MGSTPEKHRSPTTLCNTRPPVKQGRLRLKGLLKGKLTTLPRPFPRLSAINPHPSERTCGSRLRPASHEATNQVPSLAGQSSLEASTSSTSIFQCLSTRGGLKHAQLQRRSRSQKFEIKPSPKQKALASISTSVPTLRNSLGRFHLLQEVWQRPLWRVEGLQGSHLPRLLNEFMLFLLIELYI